MFLTLSIENLDYSFKGHNFLFSLQGHHIGFKLFSIVGRYIVDHRQTEHLFRLLKTKNAGTGLVGVDIGSLLHHGYGKSGGVHQIFTAFLGQRQLALPLPTQASLAYTGQ